MPKRSTHVTSTSKHAACQDPYGQCRSSVQVADTDPTVVRSAIMQASRSPTAEASVRPSVPFSASPQQKLGVTHTTKEGLTLSRGPNGELHATIQNQSNDLGIGYVRKSGAYSTETHWTKIYDQVPGGSSRLNAVKMADTYSLDVVHRGEGRTTLNVTMDRSVAAMKIQVGNKVYLLRESDIQALDTKTATPVAAVMPKTEALSALSAAPAASPIVQQLPPVVTDTPQAQATTVAPLLSKTSPKPSAARAAAAEPKNTAVDEVKPLEKLPTQGEESLAEPKIDEAAESTKSEGLKETPEARTRESSEAKARSEGVEAEVRARTVNEITSPSDRRALTVEEVAQLELPAETASADTMKTNEGAKSLEIEVARPALADPMSGSSPLVEASAPSSAETVSTPEAASRATTVDTSAAIESVESAPTEAATRTAVESSSGVTDGAPAPSTTTIAEAPSTTTSGAVANPEPSLNARLIEGLKHFNQNVKVSEWARNNQFKAISYAAAMSEAVTGAMRADYGPDDPHSPIPALLTLLNADIQKGFEFTTEQGGLAASVTAEATRSAGDVTLAFGSFATLDAGLSAAATTRVGQALGGRVAASAFSRTLGVVGVAYHGYSTFSDGSFVHQNDLQLAGSTASPVVMGAIIGAPLGPVGAGGGAVLGAGSEAVGVAVGYSRLKGQIESDWKKREVREALRLAEEGFILPSDDPRVISRKPFDQLPHEHQEMLTDVARIATLARLTRELGGNDLRALGFLPEPGNGASAGERNEIGTHNWERMIQLTEGRSGFNPYRLWAGDYLDEVSRERPYLAEKFTQFFSEAQDHYKNLYKHAPHVTYHLTSNNVSEDSELLKYIPEVVSSISIDTKKSDALKQLELKLPGIEIIMQNPRAREKLTNFLENESGNTGRFTRLFDMEDLTLVDDVNITESEVKVRKKAKKNGSDASFSLAG